MIPYYLASKVSHLNCSDVCPLNSLSHFTDSAFPLRLAFLAALRAKRHLPASVLDTRRLSHILTYVLCDVRPDARVNYLGRPYERTLFAHS